LSTELFMNPHPAAGGVCLPQRPRAEEEEQRDGRIVRVLLRYLSHQRPPLRHLGLVYRHAPHWQFWAQLTALHSFLHTRHTGTATVQPTKLGAAHPKAAESAVMTARAETAPANTCVQERPRPSLRTGQSWHAPRAIVQGAGCNIRADSMFTVARRFFMAMIAAMKKVLSPISDTKIMPLQRMLDMFARTPHMPALCKQCLVDTAALRIP
jgi:hypothetical protein